MARLAARQHDCIHRQQLIAAGVLRDAIRRRCRARRLRPLDRDVFLVGRVAPGQFSLAMAAVLHLRGDALLSHRSAGYVWGLCDEPAKIEVTLVGRNANPVDGVRIHRTHTLDRADVRWRHGLPVSSPARTLLDLAGSLEPMELENALAEVRRRRLAPDRQILISIDRAPYRAGAALLRRLVQAPEPPARTRSHYERLLLALIRQAELPGPVANAIVEGHMVDLLWADQRLVVEFDGFQFHSDRAAFERDRLRDQRLAAAGYRVIRVTARQLDRTPFAVIARLTAALLVQPTTSRAMARE